MSHFPGGQTEFSSRPSSASRQASAQVRRYVSVPAARSSEHKRRRAPNVSVPVTEPVAFLERARQDLAVLRQNRRGRFFYKNTAQNVLDGLRQAIAKAETAGHDEELYLFYQHMPVALGMISGVNGVANVFSNTLVLLNQTNPRLLLPPRPRAVPIPAVPSPPPLASAPLLSHGQNGRTSVLEEGDEADEKGRSRLASLSESVSAVSTFTPSSFSVSSSLSSALTIDSASSEQEQEVKSLRESNEKLAQENQQLKEEKVGLERRVTSLQAENSGLTALLEESRQQHQEIMAEIKKQHEEKMKASKEASEQEKEVIKKTNEELVKTLLLDRAAIVKEIIKEKDEVIDGLKATIKEKEAYIALLKTKTSQQETEAEDEDYENISSDVPSFNSKPMGI